MKYSQEEIQTPHRFETMKKRQKIRVGGARSKTKQQESSFLKKAGKLKEHPEYLVPECDEQRSFSCPFTKLQKQLDIVYKNRDSPNKIEKLARKGDHIARAYASMIKLHSEGKIPMFAAARMPWGEVSYVMRNHIGKEKQIGVQHFDDPKLRLLAYADIIKKKGVTIYSLRDRLMCHCANKAFLKPPDEFITFALASITPKLKKDLSCPHLDRKAIEDGTEKKSYLEIHWKTADKQLYLCTHCAGKTNTFGDISQYIGSKQVREHFDVNFHYNLNCDSRSGDCGCQRFLENFPDLKKDYLKGQLSDEAYIKKTENKIKENIIDSNEKFYVHNQRCFGEDPKAFLASLGADELVTRALEIALKKRKGPVVVQEQSPVQLLKEMWSESGLDILRDLTSSYDEARRLYEENSPDEISPVRIIRMARDHERHANIKKNLPSYDSLPPKARFADAVARAYKLHGKDVAVREVAGRKTDETAALAFAFYRSFGMAEKIEWKFSKEQKDYGGFLEKFVEQLLKAEDEDYHSALQAILQASGSTENIKRPKVP